MFSNQRLQGLVLTFAAVFWTAALLRYEGVCKSAPREVNRGLKMLRSEDL